MPKRFTRCILQITKIKILSDTFNIVYVGNVSYKTILKKFDEQNGAFAYLFYRYFLFKLIKKKTVHTNKISTSSGYNYFTKHGEKEKNPNVLVV